MTTPQTILRSHIHRILTDRFPDSVSLSDIYDFLDEHIEWDGDDIRPPTIEGVPVDYPSWRRNIRNTLQNDLDNGTILRPERATYLWIDEAEVHHETQSMQFPDEVEILQIQLDEERTEEVDAEEVEEEIPESQQNQDTRGWVYVLWNPAYSDWVVTGKASSRRRPQSYNTYTPHRDYEIVGISYVDEMNQGERNLQEEIDREYPNRRGARSSRGPSEWFNVSPEEAFAVLERLNPNSTYRNSSEEE